MARSFASASSQYLENGAAVVTAEPVTMACWFQVASVVTGAKTLMALSQSGGTARCLLQVSSNDKLLAWSGATGGGATAFSEHATAVSTNTWYFGAAVFANASNRLCYLGTAPSTADTTTVGMSGINRTNIGARYNSTVGVFHDGLVAEAGIWSTALTAPDIAALSVAVSPLLVRPHSLVAYWPLIGRNSPETCIEENFNLTLSNAPTTAAHCRVVGRSSPRGMG